jgi:hypothetical protein
MKQGLLFCLLLALATDAFAHRLDEYLQAVRIAVTTNRIELSIDLTPGVAVADSLLVVIDKDRDGGVSDEEGSSYAQHFLKDIHLQLDDTVLTPRLVKASFPKQSEMRSGLGVIRIKAVAQVEQLAVGNHVLCLHNAHMPEISAYLVNALVPKDHAIEIKKQTRDELQRSYRLDFSINPSAP